MNSVMSDEQRLDSEIAYANKHSDELLRKYEGRVIVVKNQKVVKACDSFHDAAIFAMDKFGDDVYLIREITSVKPQLPNSAIYGLFDSCPLLMLLVEVQRIKRERLIYLLWSCLVPFFLYLSANPPTFITNRKSKI